MGGGTIKNLLFPEYLLHVSYISLSATMRGPGQESDRLGRAGKRAGQELVIRGRVYLLSHGPQSCGGGSESPLRHRAVRRPWEGAGPERTPSLRAVSLSPF